MSRLNNNVLALLPLVPPAYLFYRNAPPSLYTPVFANFVLSVIAFWVTFKLVPIMAKYTERAGLFGYDLGKKGLKEYEGKKIPESLGTIVGTVYLMSVISFQLYQAVVLPEVTTLAEYNAALVSICLILLLGFADDVLDLPWRYKIVFPFFAAVPLLVSYAGPTMVIVPKPFRAILGLAIELGVFYKLYMALVSVFASNCINMLAGINGLETGQSLVIACSVLTHNMAELGGAYQPAHLFSIYMLIPYIGTTLALTYYNWYPSAVFVGDAFVYYSGILFAVVGILGHFSKTLMLFFVPQLINFAISLPQLFGLFGMGPCPRHRLPRLNPKTGLMEGVPTHWNLINQFLRITGPMSERSLCIAILSFQVFCSAVALWVRYPLAEYFF